jgi:NADPH-dependent 2,4-dienoyl-CoA reductase/sulfur reductase-like enzyme
MNNPEEELRRRGVPIYCQSTILSAQGDAGITEAVVTQLRPNGQHDPDATERITCDLLCLHAGFCAAVELAQMVGCAVEYNVDSGGWHVRHDGEMRTSRDGVYVAGRVAGYAGHEISVASGRLAGLAVARDLGAISAAEFAEAMEREQATIDALRLSSCQINTYSAMESELSSTITPDTLLCPEEGVRAADVDRAISLGARSFNDIKRRTRCGMGECQARICGPLVSAYVARQTGVSVESVGLMTARPPIRPIPLIAVAAFDQQLTQS